MDSPEICFRTTLHSGFLPFQRWIYPWFVVREFVSLDFHLKLWMSAHSLFGASLWLCMYNCHPTKYSYKNKNYGTVSSEGLAGIALGPLFLNSLLDPLIQSSGEVIDVDHGAPQSYASWCNLPVEPQLQRATTKVPTKVRMRWPPTKVAWIEPAGVRWVHSCNSLVHANKVFWTPCRYVCKTMSMSRREQEN